MTTTAGPLHHHLGGQSALDGAAVACIVGALAFVVALGLGRVPESWTDPTTVRVSTGAPVRFPSAARTTPTTRAAPATSVEPPPPTTPVARPVAVLPPPTVAPAPAFGTTCGDALAYLAAHQAPGVVDTCAPGSALGHYGYTCVHVVGRCPDARIVHIACPAPFVYRNEAHNTWTLIGQASGIDPYGQGTAAEQALCNRYR